MEYVILSSANNGNNLRQLLKTAGYFDRKRKVSVYDKKKLAIPVTISFVSQYLHSQFAHTLREYESELRDSEQFLRREASVEDTFSYEGISFRFKAVQGTHQLRPSIITPRQSLIAALKELCHAPTFEWDEQIEFDIPQKWERHGDLTLLPNNSFRNPQWSKLGYSLWETVAHCLGAKRLARKHVIAADDFRTPQVQLLLGNDGWVKHTDNGIKYEYNIVTNMFSAGNITEKLRVSNFKCEDETIVDLFAGIGYFTLPYLIHAGANHVHACEWNPNAVKALQRNLHLNGVANRCTVHAGDNRNVCPKGVADRVNLGLIPSSEESWPTACAALKPLKGGILHIHANVSSREYRNAAEESTPSLPLAQVNDKESSAYLQSAEDQLPHETDQYSKGNLDHGSCGILNCRQNLNSDEANHKELAGEPQNLEDNQNNETEKMLDTTGRVKVCKCLPDMKLKQQKSSCTKCIKLHKREKFVKSNRVFKDAWREYGQKTSLKIRSLIQNLHGIMWTTEVIHIEHVKSYAPHVDHIVVDIMCAPVLEVIMN